MPLMKMKVTTAALLARINRKLRHDDRQLRKARSRRAKEEFGDYVLIDVSRNLIIGKHIEPEEYGRELGVLEKYEVIEDYDE